MGRARYLLIAVLLALLALLAVGCAGTVSGQGSYLGAAPAGTPTTAAPSGSESQPSAGPPTTQSTEGTSPAPTSAGPTTASSTGASPPPPGEQVSDQGWVLASVELQESVFESFEGSATVTNTADTQRSVLFTITVFVDENLVATSVGSVSDVAPGDSATVPLLGFDPFVEGEYSYDFQVDFTF